MSSYYWLHTIMLFNQVVYISVHMIFLYDTEAALVCLFQLQRSYAIYKQIWAVTFGCFRIEQTFNLIFEAIFAAYFYSVRIRKLQYLHTTRNNIFFPYSSSISLCPGLWSSLEWHTDHHNSCSDVCSKVLSFLTQYPILKPKLALSVYFQVEAGIQWHFYSRCSAC